MGNKPKREKATKQNFIHEAQQRKQTANEIMKDALNK